MSAKAVGWTALCAIPVWAVMLLDTLPSAASWAAESNGSGSESGLCQAGHLGRDDDRDAGQLRPVGQRREGGAGRLDAAGRRVGQDPGRLADSRRVVPAGLAGRSLPRLVLADECEPALRALDHEPGPAASCRGRCCTESGTRRTGARQRPDQRHAVAGTVCSDAASRGPTLGHPPDLAGRIAFRIRAAGGGACEHEDAFERSPMGGDSGLGGPVCDARQSGTCREDCGSAISR